MKVYKDGVYRNANDANLQSLLELGYKVVKEESEEKKPIVKKGRGK